MSINNLDKKYIKISLVINIIVVFFTLIACLMMFTGFKFMYGYEPIFETTKIEILNISIKIIGAP